MTVVNVAGQSVWTAGPSVRARNPLGAAAGNGGIPPGRVSVMLAATIAATPPPTATFAHASAPAGTVGGAGVPVDAAPATAAKIKSLLGPPSMSFARGST